MIVHNLQSISVEDRLRICENTVLKHYCRVMKLLAFQNWLKPDTRCRIAINILYSMAVYGGFIALFIQNFRVSVCYEDSSHSPFPHWNVIVSALPSTGLLLVFVMLRFQPKNKIEALAQRVFCSLVGPEGTYLCQKMLLLWIKVIIGVGAVLFLLPVGSDFVRRFTNGSLKDDWFLFIFYVAASGIISTVLLHFMMQCLLLVFFAEGLNRRILCRKVTLYAARLECLEIRDHAACLRAYCTVPVMFILFMNINDLVFFTMSSEVEYLTLPMMFSCGLLVLLPVIGNLKLSSSVNTLLSTGAEVTCLMEGYMDESKEDINTFMLFLATLQIQVPSLLQPAVILFMVCALATTTYYTLMNNSLILQLNDTVTML